MNSIDKLINLLAEFKYIYISISGQVANCVNASSRLQPSEWARISVSANYRWIEIVNLLKQCWQLPNTKYINITNVKFDNICVLHNISN